MVSFKYAFFYDLAPIVIANIVIGYCDYFEQHLWFKCFETYLVDCAYIRSITDLLSFLPAAVVR